MVVARWDLPYPDGVSVNHLYVHTGRVFLSTLAFAYRDRVLIAMRQARQVVPLGNFLALTITAFMPDRRRRDVANLEKFVTDTLFGELGLDDSLVVDVILRKRWRKSGPGLIVTMSASEYQGEVLE